MKKVKLRENSGASSANEFPNQIHNMGEIGRVMKETKNSYSTVDRVGLLHICGACEEVTTKLTKIVISMFENKMIKGDKCAKSGIDDPIFSRVTGLMWISFKVLFCCLCVVVCMRELLQKDCLDRLRD